MRGRRLQIKNVALACGREPEIVRRYVARSRPTGTQILHFGWANESLRRPRYERYVEADGGKYHRNSHLESIMFPDIDVTMEDWPWPEALADVKDMIIAQSNTDYSGSYA